MSMVMTEKFGNVHIPEWVIDLKSFCRWVDTTDLPEKLSVHFIQGEVWVGVTMEELFSHNQAKTALGAALGALVEAGELGIYVMDGVLLANRKAGLGTEPDAMFFSNASLAAKRVRFTAGKKRGAEATRVVGTPDLVVEIISPNSEDKDTEWLMTAYHNAGIPEYWLIDAREDDGLRFDIFRRRPKEYVPTPVADGWLKSAVFKRSFRLTRTTGKHGCPTYKLHVR